APAVAVAVEPVPAPATRPHAAPSLPVGLDSLPLDARIVTGGGDPSYALPEKPEPGYSAVAPHIAESLLGLLDELDLPEHHRPQGEELRARLQGGVNWY